MSDVLELSIEETNKLRASLGLRPLDTSSTDDRVQIAPTNPQPEKRVYDGADIASKRSKSENTGEPAIKGIANEKLHDMVGKGEDVILTLADTNILDEEGDVLTFGTKTKEDLRDEQEVEMTKREVEGNVGVKFEEDYGGLAKRLEPLGSLGTVSTDDEYIRRQQSILSIAEQVEALQNRKQKIGIGSLITISSATKELHIPVAAETEEDMDDESNLPKKPKKPLQLAPGAGEYQVQEIDEVTSFVQGVDLPEDVIAEMTAEREVHDRVAKAYRDDKLTHQQETGEQNGEHDDMRLVRENELGDGLAAALSNLKSKGKLQDRSKVAVIRGGAGAVDTVLERRDDFGNVMTIKEAFNQLSYKFHGKKPGLNKLERQLRKRTLDKETVDGSAVNKLPTLRALHQHQKVQGQAHLSLQNATRK